MSDTKKTLLNEATIRRFMKLGGLKPLTETFFDKNETIEEEVEETIEEEVEETIEEEVQELDEMGHEVGDRDDAPEMDDAPLDAPELDEPAEEGPVGEADVKELVDAIADAITSTTGVEVSASSDAAPEEAPMDDMPMDDMPMDDVAPEEPMMETTEEETVTEDTTDTDEETVTEETDTDEVDEALVAEITRRVAARLKSVSNRENIAEKLAERIFNKLSKKG